MDLALIATSDENDLELGLEDLEAVERATEQHRLESSLHAFLVEAWPIIEPSQPFTDNWHIQELCKVLEALYDAQEHRKPVDELRAVINVPPGTLKSVLIQVIFPTWVWAKNAKKRFLTASYGQHLTIRDNVRARQIIESKWFQSFWPVKLMDDQNTKTRYNTDKSGWRIATSVDGVGTGEHPDFIIIDDPLTAQMAASDAERRAVRDWFDRTISTRQGRNPAIILVMQRLHEEDLAGHLLARGGWIHVCWPMRFEQCTCPPDADENTRCPMHKADPNWKPDPRDPRTEAGELLFPALFPNDKVRQLELDLGPYGAAGQLQQRPSPEGGGLFKREWFTIVDAKPTFARRVRGWDTAGSEGKGDYTVGVKIAEEFEVIDVGGKKVTRSTGRFFVEDVVRGQWGPDGVSKNMELTASLDGKEVAIREEQEGGSAGKAVIVARTKQLKGYDYECVHLGVNKVVRAKPFRAQCEAGNVFLVRGAWNHEYLTELSNFPNAAHDDQVDASSCAFNTVILEPPPRRKRATW